MPRGRLRLRGLLVFVAMAGAGLVVWLANHETSEPRPLVLSSSDCRECHLPQYNSWHQTFHRTMTQEVSPEAVRGDFSDISVSFKGHRCRLFQESGRFFMNLVDPDWEHSQYERGLDPTRVANSPRKTFEVHRLTGSHNMQVYLTRLDNGAFLTLPVMWHIHEKRWITLDGSFLQPPAQNLYASAKLWNDSCSLCHVTDPHPGMTADPDNPRLATNWHSTHTELGISCAICHGDGLRHAEKHRNMPNGESPDASRVDDTIVLPLRLDKQRAVELCGRCHGKWVFNDAMHRHWSTSDDVLLIPGQGFDRGHFEQPTPVPGTKPTPEQQGYFWDDWTPRATALEYQGIVQSSCFHQGNMTCFSCHSMHNADPKNQLIYPENHETAALESNKACLQCHGQFKDADRLVAHTHHSAQSAGTRCDNCHMPHLAYGLLKGVRSHRIDSPRASQTASGGMPNACNQCHVDKSLGWTASHLGEWYGHSLPEMTPQQEQLSAVLLDLTKGHALQRALACFVLGSESSLEAAPGNWRIPWLLVSLVDDYDAVRFLGFQSLRRVAGFEDARFDYLADVTSRNRQIAGIIERWHEIRAQSPPEPTTACPMGNDGFVPGRLLRELVGQRDLTEITINE